MSKVALYIRLSVEDVIKVDESESIINQRLYLNDYVKRNNEFNGFEVEEFVDDGYSGTNENRPSFQSMLNEVKLGKIQVIIVKDLSRFMRDYIALGDYLENIFPFLGIRFIAINDGYDSLKEKGNGTDIDVQFRSLLYDFYAKDISTKIKTVTTELKKQGKFLGWSPPLGYMRDPEDKYRIIIDEKTAWIVKKIFSLALEGLSTRKIASIMNAEKIPTPNNRKKELTNMKYDDRIILSKTRKSSTWSHTTILKVLDNELYTGTYVFNIYTKTNYKGSYTVKPKDEWERVEHHHEAIISKEAFEQVQKLKQGKSFPIGKNTNYQRRMKSPLQGLAKCPSCNHNLTLIQTKKVLVTGEVKKYRYFFCETCKSNNIHHKNSNVDILEYEVLEQIKSKYDVAGNSTLKKGNYTDLEDEVEKLKRKKLSNFEKYKSGILTKGKFVEIKKSLEKEILLLEEELASNEKEELVLPTSELTRELMEKYIVEVSCEASRVQKIVWK